MRYLAIDYGTRRTGLAICDVAETIVSPLRTIHGQRDLLKKIGQVVDAEHVEAVVLGLPLNMDGSESAQTRIVLNFAERLRAFLEIPVHLQDERLSSFGAAEKLAQANLSKDKLRERLDAVAAAEILEAFLYRETSNDADRVSGE